MPVQRRACYVCQLAVFKLKIESERTERAISWRAESLQELAIHTAGASLQVDLPTITGASLTRMSALWLGQLALRKAIQCAAQAVSLESLTLTTFNRSSDNNNYYEREGFGYGAELAMLTAFVPDTAWARLTTLVLEDNDQTCMLLALFARPAQALTSIQWTGSPLVLELDVLMRFLLKHPKLETASFELTFKRPKGFTSPDLAFEAGVWTKDKQRRPLRDLSVPFAADCLFRPMVSAARAAHLQRPSGHRARARQQRVVPFLHRCRCGGLSCTHKAQSQPHTI